MIFAVFKILVLAQFATANCPWSITDLVKQDNQDSFFTKSYYPTCKKYVVDDLSSSELKLQFQKYLGKGLGPQIHQNIQSCSGTTEGETKELLSKSYYYFLRLEKEQQSNLEQLTSIDLILKNKPINELNCEVMKFDSLKDRCHQIKSKCESTISMKDLVDSTLDAKKEIEDYEKLKSKIQLDLKLLNSPDQLGQPGLALKSFIKTLELKVALVKSHRAWMNGLDYQRAMKHHETEESAIRIQLQKNRQTLLEAYREGALIQSCLEGQSTKLSNTCGGDRLRAYFDKTFRLANGLNFKMGDSRKDALATYEYMEMQECAHDSTTDRTKTAQFRETMAISMAVTIVSAGFGSIYNAQRALLSARNFQMAEFAKVLNQGVNATYFTQALSTALIECLSDDRVVESKDFSHDQCRVSGIYEGSQAIHKYDDCVGRIAWTGVQASPYARSYIHRLLTDGDFSKLKIK